MKGGLARETRMRKGRSVFAIFRIGCSCRFLELSRLELGSQRLACAISDFWLAQKIVYASAFADRRETLTICTMFRHYSLQ